MDTFELTLNRTVRRMCFDDSGIDKTVNGTIGSGEGSGIGGQRLINNVNLVKDRINAVFVLYLDSDRGVTCFERDIVKEEFGC